MINLKVKDFMAHQPLIISPDSLIAQVIEALESSHLDSAIVVNDNKIVGLLSERDCLKTLMANSYYCDGAPHVTEFMKTEFTQISEEDSILDLAEKVVNNSAGFCDQTSFPVLRGEQLVGVIGVSGLVEALNQHFTTCKAY